MTDAEKQVMAGIIRQAVVDHAEEYAPGIVIGPVTVEGDAVSFQLTVPAHLAPLFSTSDAWCPGCYAEAMSHKHGQCPKSGTTAAYRTWQAIIVRCTNPNHVAYHRYGGRGIAVCDAWRTFANFFADMGTRPPGHSIDRIDNDKGYEPGNCRWATAKSQGRNRGAKTYEVGGERLVLVELAERYGVAMTTLRMRLSRGCPLELAIVPGSRSGKRPTW